MKKSRIEGNTIYDANENSITVHSADAFTVFLKFYGEKLTFIRADKEDIPYEYLRNSPYQL